MWKKIVIILFIIPAIWAIYKYKTMPTTVYPFPYYFESVLYADINNIEKSEILVVGDQMATTLTPFFGPLNESISKGLKSPLRIFNWGREHEGMHRTLHKLQSLKKLPPVIIYHGGNSELYESIFHVTAKDSIFTNFERAKSDELLSLIMTFPILSRFIYKNPKFTKLMSEIKKNKRKYTSLGKQTQMEMAYKLFEYQIEEMVKIVRSKGSAIVLMTTPHNLDIPPRSTCGNTETEELKRLQKKTSDLIEKGDFKSALKHAKMLAIESTANAKSFYLMGQVYKGLGRISDAKNNLLKAAIFDCTSWRGNGVYNAILKNVAKKYDLPLLDFDWIVTRQFGRNELFLDEIFPQNLYYQEAFKKLEVTVREILQI